MANLITLSRLMLLLIVVAFAYWLPPVWQLINVPLLILVFVTDALDGYVARRRNESSQFGAMFDIASDRIVEWTLWIVFVDLGLVPVWVLLVFVMRGVIVDAIRSSQVSAHGENPFAMMRSAVGKWLVAGKFMRVSYAVLKAVTFCWLMLVHPLPEIAGVPSGEWLPVLLTVAEVLVYASVALCLVRGVPVIVEFVHAERHSLLGSLSNRPRERGIH